MTDSKHRPGLFCVVLSGFLLIEFILVAWSVSRSRKLKDTVSSNSPVADNAVEGLEESVESSDEERHASLGTLFLVLILIFSSLISYSTRELHISYLPESVFTILLGLVAGGTIKMFGDQNELPSLLLQLDPQGFFLFLLPPIIFESGLSLRRGDFLSNFFCISVFAVFGTIISTLVVGTGMYLLGSIRLSMSLPLVDCFLFASLISAIDPVCTLAIFRVLGVPRTLNVLVFGESVLNDAVAISIYRALESWQESGPFTWISLLALTGQFFLVFVGSAILGIAVTMFFTLMFKHLDLRNHPSMELSLTILSAYCPYLVAESLGLSGIIAILFAGAFMAHYTSENLSSLSRSGTHQISKVVAYLSETLVFAFIGLAVFAFSHHLQLGMVFWSTVLCLLGRAANIFPLSYIMNRSRQANISLQEQCIMWFSGLRGAIAFVLSLSVSTLNRGAIVSTTLFLVLFTIIVFGGATFPLLKCLRVKTSSVILSKDVDSDKLGSDKMETGQLESLSRFERMDLKYLKPWLTRESRNTDL